MLSLQGSVLRRHGRNPGSSGTKLRPHSRHSHRLVWILSQLARPKTSRCRACLSYRPLLTISWLPQCRNSHRFLQFQPEFLLFIALPPHFAVPCYSYTHRGHVGRPSTSWPHFLIKSRFTYSKTRTANFTSGRAHQGSSGGRSACAENHVSRRNSAGWRKD